MRRRKLKFLLVALLVVPGLLFSGGEARAAIFAYSISGEVTSSTTSSATFRYTLTKTGDTTLSYIDLEIPVEIVLTAGTFPPAGNPYFSVSVTGATAGNVEIYGEGIGDFGTKFGVGDPRYRVMKVNLTPPTTNQPFTIAITLKGQSFQDNRRFGDSNNSEKGAILIKAGNGSNTQTFVTVPTPTVVNPPVTPPPVLSSFSANPNPVQQISNNSNSTCTTLSWNATTGSTVTLTANAQPLASEQPANGTYPHCPTATTTYQATASDANGTSTPLTVIVTVNPAVGPGVFTEFLANPSSITSGEQPLCVTLSWTGPTGTVAISAGGVTLASGLPGAGTYQVCPTVTTEFTATASSSGGTVSATATVTVNEPVIQTSCMQILKRPAGGTPTCTNVCFEVGGERRLVSAEIYYNENCEPPGIPLAVFGPDVSDPALRVPSLTCFPCDVVAAGELRTPVCSGDLYAGTPLEPPFDVNLGTHKVRCEFILKSYEPSGYTVDLGADPQFWNGARWINTPSCPTGYYDCRGICKKIGTACP